MELIVLNKRKDFIELYLSNVPLYIINSIRRIVISEVPSMAISTVIFTLNRSMFYDEYIAHRLGLVPLTSEPALSKYKPPEECSESEEASLFPPDCFVKLDLDASNNGEGLLTIYSKDLKSSDPEVKPVYDDIPILILGGGHKVKLEAYARLGRGREHYKWSPASAAVIKYIPEVFIDRSRCLPECRKCIEVCPRNVFKATDSGVEVSEAAIINCNLCHLCEKVCPSEAVMLKTRENEYILRIESTGSLSPKRILLESIKILEGKVSELSRKLEVQGVLK
ncbi:MAG: DNA-directed RNA polymerase subunit D [Sulfolobales archaeon]|nr:DNA-directed RNA polymerase subunit D [Sulfolobales archaeon]MCX8199604.1 DNA-directed RNA polymerase subunit D [Sulfolobales archaeon]MDW8170557.1 DNA-directed RNA polymerase subunit D [Desulfurococcaceae archaeon]